MSGATAATGATSDRIKTDNPRLFNGMRFGRYSLTAAGLKRFEFGMVLLIHPVCHTTLTNTASFVL